MVKSETDIINAINNHIAQYRLIVKDQAYVGYDFLDDIIANLCVCYFYFIDPIAEKQLPAAINNVDMFASFKTAFSRYLKHKGVDKDYLKSLNRDGLYQYFVKCLVAKLTDDKKIEFCKNISLITIDETNQRVVFPKVEKVYEAYSKDSFAAENNIPDDYFGEEDYVFEEHPHEDSIEDCLTQNAGGDRARRTYEDKKKKTEELYEGLKAIDALGGNIDDIRAGKYVWQLQLNFSQWQRIKEVCEQQEVKERIKVWGDFDESHTYDRSIAAMLLIYVGEWNKREWNGNEGDTRLGDVIQTNTAMKIVRTLQDERPEFPCVKYEDQRHTRWLDALKVQGGFPLWYIYNQRDNVNNPYFSLFRFLLKNSEQELDWDNQVPRTVESNSTYRLSNEKNDSIAQYSRVILEQQYPYDANDFINEENGVKFEALGEILRTLANSKFRYSWQVSKIGASAYVRLQISFRDERDLVNSSDERKYAIQEKRLSYWLNQDQGELPESFFVSFNQPKTKKVLKKIYFDRCTDDSWIPRASYQYRYQLPFENENKISVSINGVEFFDNLHTDEEKDYQLMYSEDNIHWASNTISKRKAYFACLIFDVDKYINTPGLERINGGYGWVRSADNHIILLTDENGREIRIFNSRDKLIASSIGASDSDNCTTCLKKMDYVVDRENYVMLLPSSSNPNEEENGDVEESTPIMIPNTHIIQPHTQFYFYKYNEKTRSKIENIENITIREGDQEYQLGKLPIGYHIFTFSYEGKEVTDKYFVLLAEFGLEKIIANNNSIRLSINGLLDGMSVNMLEDTMQISGGLIYFNKNDHKDLQYTLCLIDDNHNQLQIPIIPPYEDSILVPQDLERVIPLPFFWNIRTYEKKNSYDKPAEQAGYTVEGFFEQIGGDNEVRNLGENRREGTYEVAPEVVSREDQYRFYYFDGETSKQLQVGDDRKLVLDDCKSWNGRRGVIIQSYEDKTLSPRYFYRPCVLNAWVMQPSLTALLFAMHHRCMFRDIMGNISNTKFDIWIKLLEEYFNYCQKNDQEIIWQRLWRLAKEYKFDWIWLWPTLMKKDERYIRLLEERVPEPWIVKCKMKALLQQLLRNNNYNSRKQTNQSIRDMLKLMYRPNECYRRRTDCYELGKALEVFGEDIMDDIQKIQEILEQ